MSVDSGSTTGDTVAGSTAARRSTGVALLACLMLSAGCNGAVMLQTLGPPKAPVSPLDAASVLLEDSVAETVVLLELQPALRRLEHALDPDRPREVPEASDDPVVPEETGEAGAPTSSEGEGDAPGAAPTADDGEAMDDGDVWLTLADGVGAQVRVRAESIRVEWVAPSEEPGAGPTGGPPEEERDPAGPRLVIEADLKVGVLARVGAGPNPAVRTCGCDGEEWCGGDKSSPRRVKARWTTDLSLKSDWRLDPETSTTVSEVGRCALGRGPDGRWLQPMEFIQEQVEAAVQAAAAQLDEGIGDIEDVRGAVNRIWNSLDTAVTVDPEQGEVLWLRPHAVRAEPLELRDERLAVPLRFALRPVLSPSSEPRELHAAPDSSEVELAEPGLRLAMALNLSLEEASTRLARKLVGHRFTERGFRHLTIKGADVHGSPKGPVVRIEIEGSAKGSLFLRGRLKLDPETRTVSLDELDFDQQSKVALASLYDLVELPNLVVEPVRWVDPDIIRDVVRKAAQWRFAQGVEDLRARIETALQGSLTPDDQPRISVDEVGFQNLVMDGEAIRLLVVFRGQLEATVDGAGTQRAVAPPDETDPEQPTDEPSGG